MSQLRILNSLGFPIGTARPGLLFSPRSGNRDQWPTKGVARPDVVGNPFGPGWYYQPVSVLTILLYESSTSLLIFGLCLTLFSSFFQLRDATVTRDEADSMMPPNPICIPPSLQGNMSALASSKNWCRVTSQYLKQHQKLKRQKKRSSPAFCSVRPYQDCTRSKQGTIFWTRYLG